MMWAANVGGVPLFGSVHVVGILKVSLFPKPDEFKEWSAAWCADEESLLFCVHTNNRTSVQPDKDTLQRGGSGDREAAPAPFDALLKRCQAVGRALRSFQEWQ